MWFAVFSQHNFLGYDWGIKPEMPEEFSVN